MLNNKLKNYMVDYSLMNENISIVILNDVVFVSMYFNLKNEDNTNRDVQIDLNQLTKILIKYENKPILILTDTNCRNEFWGDLKNNKRGKKLLNFIIANNLDILNRRENGPTFKKLVTEKNGRSNLRSSYIDLSIHNDKFNYVN